MVKFGRCPTPGFQVNFDPTRYLGVWYEFARADNRFQSDLARCTTAEYSLTDENTKCIEVRNTEMVDQKVKQIVGKAYYGQDGQDASLAVSFSKFMEMFGGANYSVVSTDYDTYSVVYSGTNVLGFIRVEYCWLLVRDPKITREQVEPQLKLLESIGFDLGELIYSPREDPEEGLPQFARDHLEA